MFDKLKKRLGLFSKEIEKIERKEESHVKEKEGLSEEIKLTKVTKIKHAFKDKIRLSKKDLSEILNKFQLDLIQSDIAYQTAEKITEKLKNELSEKEIPKERIREYIKNLLKEILIDILNSAGEIDILELVKNSEKPFKIVFFGVNGCGKTTTIAKVANFLMKNNFSVVLAAADTFRAGAIEQLEKHAQSLGIKVIKHKKGADAAAVIYDAIAHAKSKGINIVLADTAGRMQTNINLMDEMKKICRVNKPDLKIFVGDALTGNDAIYQAEYFNDEIGIDAIILTKMDADVKGGSALSIVDVTKKPIIFVGTGQGYDDLKKFDKEWFMEKILQED